MTADELNYRAPKQKPPGNDSRAVHTSCFPIQMSSPKPAGVNSKIDFQSIANDALNHAESLLTEWFPSIRKSGSEWCIGGLDGHAGDSLKISPKSGKWADFSAGKGGIDLVALRAAQLGITQPAAARDIAARLGLPIDAAAIKSAPRARRVVAEEWTALASGPDEPAPTHHPRKVGEEWHRDPVAAHWAYRTASGDLAGYICRVNNADGSKETFPMAFCESREGVKKWRWKAMRAPRPLYRLPELLADASAPVLIVEGEKSADAAVRLVGDIMSVVTWSGGCKAISLTDLAPLAGRRVFIWPDADAPGIAAAQYLSDALREVAVVTVLTPRADWPKGFDIADMEAGATTAEARAAALAFLDSYPNDEYAPDEPEQPDEPDDAEPPFTDESSFDSAPVPRAPTPFAYLGHDNGTHYFLPARVGQVMEIAAESFGKASFLALAPLAYWLSKYEYFDSKGNSRGINWTTAADEVMSASCAAGIYDPSRIRGRGAWIDADSFVFHAGDHLVVNGATTALADMRGDYIYQASRKARHEQVKPLTNREASKIIELAELFSLSSGINARLLAGWCALAPICGVVHWRPHLWLSGPSGSGKSWIIENFIKPTVGDFCVSVQSATTEAGLRQTIGRDAIPVIFDEAESENERGSARIQSVIELARQASAEGGASIIKGSAAGRAQEFMVHSMFLFASIGVASVQRADTSRICVCDLSKRDDADNATMFPKIKALARETTLKPDWCAALRSRTFANAATIRANAKTFAGAVAQHLGDSRAGDQFGTLLAGAHSLTSSALISMADAATWVARQEWQREIDERGETDEQEALDMLLSATVRHEPKGEPPRTVAISELVAMCDDDGNTAYEANRTLQLHGIRSVDDGCIFVSAKHRGLDAIFRDSRFVRKHSRILARIAGATDPAHARISGQFRKGIKIPLPR